LGPGLRSSQSFIITWAVAIWPSKGKQYVTEITVTPKSSQAEDAAKNAIKLIIDEGYDSSFPNPVLVALGIFEEKRNIDVYFYVENNKTTRHD
jgi:hypothetical protein